MLQHCSSTEFITCVGLMLSVHGKKRNAPDISRKSIAEMFPPTKPGYTALLRQPNQGDREVLYSELRTCGKLTGLCWLLNPEPKQPGGFLSCLNSGRAYFFRRIYRSIYCCRTTRVYQTKINGRERNCKSNQFFNCRSEKQSLRLTASNFGSVSRLLSVSWGNMTFHVSKLWHGESQMRPKPSKHLLPKPILKLLKRGCGLTSRYS